MANEPMEIDRAAAEAAEKAEEKLRAAEAQALKAKLAKRLPPDGVERTATWAMAPVMASAMNFEIWSAAATSALSTLWM